jgi:hypothetical protein
VLGELGIVQTALSPDTWRAGASGAVVYAVDRRTLHALLHGAAGRRRQRAANALLELQMLEALTKGQLYSLVDVMRRAEVPSGAPLHDAFLHILLRGSVRLSDRGALHRCTAAEEEPTGPLTGPVLARAGDAYGEAACLANGANPLGIAITAATDAEVMLCDRDTFARVLGPPEALLLPGARKVSLPRQPPRDMPGAAEAALASGVGAVALSGNTIREDADAEAAAALEGDGDVAMPNAPPLPDGALTGAPATEAGGDAALVAAASAKVAVGGSGNRFRTPNQDVTWHGSTSVRRLRRCKRLLVCSDLLLALQAIGALAKLPAVNEGAPLPKSALTMSLGGRLMAGIGLPAAKALGGKAPPAVPLPAAPPLGSTPPASGDRSAGRAVSAPAELSNIVSGAPSPGGGAPAPRGAWRMSLALGDFLLGAKLGEGLTGRVHYAKLKVRGAECALKVMRKSKLVELGEEHHVRSELDALGRIASPFVTALLGCFQDTRAVYLAIEYMRGPDLFAYMCASCGVHRACAHSRAAPCFARHRHEINAPTGFERSVPMQAVRFYTAQVPAVQSVHPACVAALLRPHAAGAQVLLGLDALHTNGYVYR